MNIEPRRKALGLTQVDIAKKLGVDQSSVHLWESGKTKPRVDTLIKLAELLKCTVNDLLDESNEVHTNETGGDI